MDTQLNDTGSEAELDKILKESNQQIKQLAEEAKRVANQYQNTNE